MKELVLASAFQGNQSKTFSFIKRIFVLEEKVKLFNCYFKHNFKFIMNAKYIMEKNSHFTFICILKHKTF